MIDETLRVLCLLGSAGIAGFAFMRVRARVGSKRWALITLGAYAASAVLSQLTLIHAPLNIRTYATFAATVAGFVYIAATARDK